MNISQQIVPQQIVVGDRILLEVRSDYAHWQHEVCKYDNITLFFFSNHEILTILSI